MFNSQIGGKQIACQMNNYIEEEEKDYVVPAPYQRALHQINLGTDCHQLSVNRTDCNLH